MSALAGLGFGIPCAFGIAHLARTGEVWEFLGFPTYGEGPFDKVGLKTSVPLLAGFQAVCVAEVGLAVAIWRRSPRAATLSHALLPFELAYWIGFALPLGPPTGLARTAMVVAGK
jgi:hypothetical protein